MTHRRTKIICTIGPSCSSQEQIEKLIQAGMNVARLNFSHGTHEEHGAVIARLKAARQKLKVPLSIMLDTKGPEIRVSELKEPIVLKAKSQYTLVKKTTGQPGEIAINPPNVVDDITEGMTILFDDGYIIAKAIGRNERGAIIEIQNDGLLKSRKGINIPHESVKLPALTPQDIEDIRFGCEQDVDYVAASFIRSAEHVMEIKHLLQKFGHGEVLVLAKIENAEGVKNFDTIVQVADGIMVARGDLGVEMPVQQVPILQKMMIRKCYTLSKPVVTATQMLESMIQNPRPTRAEVSDVANAIYDSTSAVMLSGETAVGKYPIEAVEMMRSVIEETEKDFDYKAFFRRENHGEIYNVSSSVALAAVTTAYGSKAKVIFVFTKSGRTGRAMAGFRPQHPVIAVTPNAKSYHQLALIWGIVPLLENVTNVADGLNVASCYALKSKLARYGDLVVISAGSPFGISGTTNTMIVENIGDVLVRGMSGKGKRVHGPVTVILSPDKCNPEIVKGKIIVISTCDESALPLIRSSLGVILQNHSDDLESEKQLKAVAKEHEISYITRAENASSQLEEGQTVTLDPYQGLVFEGALTSEEEMISRVCFPSH